jgi:hypothetical protein
MAVTYVDQREATDQLISSRNVVRPPFVSSGDVVVLFLDRWDGGGSFPAVTAPTGAVLRGTVVNGEIQTQVWIDYVQGEAGWNFTWTGARWSSLSAIFLRGVDSGLDLSAVPFNTATGTGTAISTTSVTTATGAGLVWNCNTHAYDSSTTHAQPTGYTEVHEFDAYDTSYKIATSSSESASSATISSSQAWIAALVALAAPSSGGPVALDAKGSAAAQGSGSAVMDRPLSAGANTGESSSGGLGAARPVAGGGSTASATTAQAGATRAVASTLPAAAAVTGDATFDRGLTTSSGAGAAVAAAMSVARPFAAGANAAAAYATGSLVGGIVDLSGSAISASTALSGTLALGRGMDGSASAASDAVGSARLTLALASVAAAAADGLSDFTVLKSWYRLVVPQIVERYTFPGSNGSLSTTMAREVTVFGDENGLFTSNQGSIPEGGDDYGAIPFGTKYIWYGGHVNLTDDPAIRDLWLAHGFEVEIVQV